jgi:peptidoglycan/LPS O-acetylase OafA/YrhL
MSQREFYIDRLRSVMTVLVILHHTAITYGAVGGWFWRERQPDGSPSSLALILFCTVNQAYFMGFFFLLAGYFTPASLERKGYAQFIGDRFLRLGLPLLAFILILGPLTAAMVTAAEGHGFWPTIIWLWNHHEIINGPLWFAQALLLFGLGYCGWRAAFAAPLSDAKRTSKLIPGGIWWLASALCVGAAALAIRQFVPTGVNVIGLQLGYFATYIFLFAAGIVAWRYDWLEQLSWKNARTALAAAILALPAMPAAVAYVVASHSADKANFSGGLSWTAILYAFWEPFVAWGLIAAWLLIFRQRMNRASAIWAWLNRRAYAVYIIHPPVLVGISLLLHEWAAPALVKFGVTGTLSCAACWLIADPLVRLPGLRRVV